MEFIATYVGSSNKSISGFLISARAIATRYVKYNPKKVNILRSQTNTRKNIYFTKQISESHLSLSS